MLTLHMLSFNIGFGCGLVLTVVAYLLGKVAGRNKF